LIAVASKVTGRRESPRGFKSLSLRQYLCGHSSVGRARRCQRRGRGFNSRWPLQIFACVAQLDRAPVYETGGQRFESFFMRQLIGCTDIERLYVSQKQLIMAVWWNGIHRGFKIPRSKDHSGSNPEAATTIKINLLVSLKSQLS
jgi:hypothetical protein